MKSARSSTVILDMLDVDQLLDLTGWHLEARGACRDDVCVPVPEGARNDPRAMATALGVALAKDDVHDVWAVGPEVRPRALAGTDLPDLTLRRTDGRPFALRSLIGRRGVLAAWASW